jgi:hypothetical protein
MATEHALSQVRTGMAVHTADGHNLGKVTHIWYGTDPTATNPQCDDEVCSRLEVHRGVLGGRTLYVPYSAIGDVVAGRVRLSMDAASANEHNWHRQPAWIAAAGGREADPFDDLGRVTTGRSG